MIKKLFENLHFSGTILAFVTVCLVLSMNNCFEKNTSYSFFIFFSILAIYGIHRLLKYFKNNLNSNHYNWIQGKEKIYLIFTGISFFISILSFVYVCQYRNNDSLVYLAIVLTCLYIVPQKKISLRFIPRFKAIVISVVWTLLIYYWPFIENPNSLFFLAYFFYYLHLSIISDIKDVKIDPLRLKTIPMEWGFKRTYVLSAVFLLISSMLFFQETKSIYTVGFFSIQLLTLGIIYISKKNLYRFYDYSMILLAVYNFLLWE